MFEQYYRTLNLVPPATDEEIKAAYRQMVKIYHPDRSGTPETRDKFFEITQAYNILLNRREHFQKELLRYYILLKRQELLDKKQQEKIKKQEPYIDPVYDRFSRSLLFRTAMIMNSAFDYIFLAMGLLMILTPVLKFVFDPSPSFFGNSMYVLPMLLGVFFSTGIIYFLFLLPRKEKKRQRSQ